MKLEKLESKIRPCKDLLLKIHALQSPSTGEHTRESKLLLSKLKINQSITHPQEKRTISKSETKIKKKLTCCSSFESPILKLFLLILNYHYSHSICPLAKDFRTTIFFCIFLCRYGKHPAAEWRKKTPKYRNRNQQLPTTQTNKPWLQLLFVPSSCKNRVSCSFRKKPKQLKRQGWQTRVTLSCILQSFNSKVGKLGKGKANWTKNRDEKWTSTGRERGKTESWHSCSHY